MAVALLFNISDTNKKRSIEKILSVLNIKFKEVSPNDQGQAIGYLTEVEGFEHMERAVKNPFHDEMLVLHDLSERKMGQFLQELRSAGLSIALKAVTTPTNRLWTCTELHSAVRTEHERIKKQLQ